MLCIASISCYIINICLQHHKSVTHTALFCTIRCLSSCIWLLINKVYPLKCHCIVYCINCMLFFFLCAMWLHCADWCCIVISLIWLAELCVYLSRAPSVSYTRTFNSKAFVLAPSSWSLWNPNSVLQIEDNTGGSVLLYLHRIHLHRFNMRGRLIKMHRGSSVQVKGL